MQLAEYFPLLQRSENAGMMPLAIGTLPEAAGMLPAAAGILSVAAGNLHVPAGKANVGAFAARCMNHKKVQMHAQDAARMLL